MKKFAILLALIPNLLFAEEVEKLEPQISRTKSTFDLELKGNQAIFEFQFEANVIFQEAEVYYSIDGTNGRQLTQNAKITVETTAGNHIFQFYFNEQFYEVYSDSLLIKARHRDLYTVRLDYSEQREMLLKPIIYLYPQRSTEVNVKIDIHGEEAFLYPTYTDSWNFTAEPNGDLIFGDETYNYLFWEATQQSIISPKQTASGFFVEGKNTIQFFEDKLTQAGFNSKEQADFITFWGPRLAQNKLNFVHFEFNETCDKYAELDISPKPDNLYRIFMTWGPVSEVFEVKEQTIEAIDRSGFSILEWGGKETHIKQSFVNQI